MQRTEGFAKGFMSVFYINAAGIKHHMMDFQICTFKTDGSFSAVDCCHTKIEACKANRKAMPCYIQDALAAVEANEYELVITFGVLV